MAEEERMSLRSAVRHSAGLIAIALGFEDLVHEQRPEDFPRASTRGHFAVDYRRDGVWDVALHPIRGMVEAFQQAASVTLTDDHTETDYDTVGDIPGWGGGNGDLDVLAGDDGRHAADDGTGHGESPDEILVFVHGWLADEENGLGRSSLLRYVLQEHGYDHPVVGFSWDADQQGPEWRIGVEIAARNGPKLGQFLHDYRVRNPETRIRLVSNSLGSEVLLESLHALDQAGLEDVVDTAAMMGAASPCDTIDCEGRYGDAMERAAREVHSFWIPHDGTLRGPYRLADDVDALGGTGPPEDPPANFTAHEVDVPDHFSFYMKEDGCIPELLASFEDRPEATTAAADD